jgi:hypothetical protein
MRAYFKAVYSKGLLDVAVRNADLQTQTTSIVGRRHKAGAFNGHGASPGTTDCAAISETSSLGGRIM